MKQATLHQLQVLESIARHGSFSHAAEALELTQPTMLLRRLSNLVVMTQSNKRSPVG